METSEISALLNMDHDSGYVEGESHPNLPFTTFNTIPNNLPLNEDALLEKPNVESDNDEATISASSSGSKGSTYSGFDDDVDDSESVELPVEPQIVVEAKEMTQLPPKKRLTLVFSKSIQNFYTVKRKYPSLTPEKQSTSVVDSNFSPDLFEASEVLETVHKTESKKLVEVESYVEKLDKKLLKKTARAMSAVLPPPNVTVIHMSAAEILTKLETNKDYWFWNSTTDKKNDTLLLSTTVPEAKLLEFPKILDVRCHGLHYNCGKTTEQIIDLCDKYQKRHVGAETQSTCTVFDSCLSPSKRRFLRPKWSSQTAGGGAKSPGRRLSHLARRRITFSSSNLQLGGASLVGSRARQILVDAKKIDLLNQRRSPKKTTTTPTRSPRHKTRTPSSSAKKKLAMRFRKLTGELELSAPGPSRIAPRPLFKSPAKSEGRFIKKALFQSPTRSSADKTHLRRALFSSPHGKSPTKRSPFKQIGYERKRKRSETDEEPPLKLARSYSLTQPPIIQRSIPRTQSDLNITTTTTTITKELSDQHKKKLLWAVSGALQTHNITQTHPQWKSFASVLARVTRRFFVHQMSTSGGASTTERMQRIARCHVAAVIKGKTAEEIVTDYLKVIKTKQKPQGYIPPPSSSTNNEGGINAFQDRSNTIGSVEKVKTPMKSATKIDRIRKVINFGEN